MNELLKQINDRPAKLFCLGNEELLKEEKLVAVVGSRRMSEYGKWVIREMVPELVKNSIVIVSGMAFGVDAEAQRVCIENGGKTIAVLASGVDVVSPKGNEWLYQMILKNRGLIVSEYKNGTEPSADKFLSRNRIISGLSLGVLVVEGAARSGAMNTAANAAKYGREVWAVPGRINDENSATPNWLIKNGAKLVSEVGEILEDL